MTVKYTFWEEADGTFLGYLNDFPDHWTQGESLKDLQAHLRDLFDLFSGDPIPGIKKVGELEIAAG